MTEITCQLATLMQTGKVIYTHITQSLGLYSKFKATLIFSADDRDNLSVGYSDADWEGDLYTHHSISGSVLQIQSNTASWCSKRQATVSKPSTESEHVALSGLEQKEPSTIYEDNQGAIEFARDPRFHNCTKHIDVSFHYMREQVNFKTISIKVQMT